MGNLNEVVYAINGLVVINNNEERTSYIVEDVGFKTINSLVSYTKRHIGQEVENLNSAYYTELNTYAVTLPDFKGLDNFKKTMVNKYMVYTKYRNQTFARMFGGVPPKVVVACLNGLLYQTYIKPVNHLAPLWHHCKHKKMVKDMAVMADAVKRTEYILMFEPNVSSFGMLFDNPQIAKKELGKGLWKSLCSNSNNKNCLIVAHALEGVKNCCDKKSIIEGLNKLPSTWLNRFRNMDMFLPTVFVNGVRNTECWMLQLRKSGESLNKMFSAERIQDVVRDYHLIKDTFDMACDVRGPFDPSWSMRKLNEMHNKYVHEQIIKESSPERFIGLETSNVPAIIEKAGFKATLLSSSFDYAMERELQKHCIYSYANKAERLEYFAYKIEGPDGFRSTLGFDNGGRYIQHYKKHNQVVSEHEAIEFVSEILKKCNIKSQSKPVLNDWDAYNGNDWDAGDGIEF